MTKLTKQDLETLAELMETTKGRKLLLDMFKLADEMHPKRGKD